MKKRLLTMVLAATFALSGFGVRAHAEGETATAPATSVAGITPDSVLYPLDKLIDQIKIIFSFTDGSKVQTLINIAQERLAESQVMANEDKDTDADEALQEYKDTIQDANTVVDKAITQNQTTDDQKTADEVAGLEDKVDAEQTAATPVLQNMTTQVTQDAAKSELTIIIQMQQAKSQAVRAMVDARHELNAARKAYNMAKVALAKAEKSGTADDITKAKAALDAALQTYTEKQKLFSDAFAQKQAVIAQFAGAKLADTTAPTTSTTNSTAPTTTNTADSTATAPAATTAPAPAATTAPAAPTTTAPAATTAPTAGKSTATLNITVDTSKLKERDSKKESDSDKEKRSEKKDHNKLSENHNSQNDREHDDSADQGEDN